MGLENFVLGNAFTTALLTRILAEKIGISNDEIADALEKSSNDLIELMEESSKSSDGFDASGFRRSIDFHMKFIRFSDKENQGNIDG